MKTLPAGLQDDLDSGATTLCWAWRVTRADGVVLGFTDHDRPLTFDATTFEPQSGFSASELRNTADLAVDAQDADGALRSPTISETDILDGRWDNALVEVFRVDWSDTAKRVLMRRGAIGQITRGTRAFTAEVRSLAHVLNVPVGRTYQRYCDAELGDARCTVDLEDPDFSAAGEVDTVESDRSFVAAGGLESYDDGWFTLGVVEWTSGANDGRRSEIAAHVLAAGVVTIELLEPPVRGISPGDDFTIRAGCDKQAATCVVKFDNLLNFRGFPHIPPADLPARVAGAGDPNTGGSLVGGGG